MKSKHWIPATICLSLLAVAGIIAIANVARFQNARLYSRLRNELRPLPKVLWEVRPKSEPASASELTDIGLVRIPSEPDMTFKDLHGAYMAKSSKWSVVRANPKWLMLPEGFRLKDRAALDTELNRSFLDCLAMNQTSLRWLDLRMMYDVFSGTSLTHVVEEPGRLIGLSRPRDGTRNTIAVTLETGDPPRHLLLHVYGGKLEITDDQILDWAKRIEIIDGGPTEAMQLSDEFSKQR